MFRVAIVDDERIVKLAVQSMIEWGPAADGSEGLELAGTASDGAEALELAHRERLDIVITDLKMAGMDGLELLAQLRRLDQPPEVIVLSNFGDFAYVREALKGGALDYVLKTDISPEKLMACIREAEGRLRGRGRGDAVDGEGVSFIIDAEGGLEGLVAAFASAAGAGGGPGRPPRGRLRGALMAFSLDQDSDRPAERALRSLAPQCLKSCERCAISVSDSGQLFLMPLFPEQLDFDPRGAATWLADQARLYYGLLSGVAWSAPFSDQAGLEEAFGACSRAAELFFYARNAGKSLEASRRSLPSRAVLDELERALPGPGWQSADALRDFRSVAARAADLDLPPGFLKAICSRSAAYLAATGGRDEGARAAARSAVAAIAEADSDGRLLEAVALTLDPDALVSSAPRACRPEIKLVLERLDSRLADRVSVPDLAREAGLSESYLCTVFKAQVGKSIVGYVNDKRLERAMDLLRTGRYLVKEAASEVGLDDPFYFNRLFKRRFGISPSSVIP